MNVTKQIEYREVLDQYLDVRIAAREVKETVADFVSIVGQEYITEFEDWLKARVEHSVLRQALQGDIKAAKELLCAWYPEKYDTQVRKIVYEEKAKRNLKGFELPRLKIDVVNGSDRK